MSLYESIFIANQELTPKQVDDLVQNFADFLKNAGGKVVSKEYWGVRNFAYTINKQKKGHYVMLCVDCSADNIVELGNRVKSKEEILKNFNIKVDSFSENSSPLAKIDKE